MSLLRLSRPGYPTQLIVQDPAHAEVQGRGGAAIGWFSGTVLESKRDRDLRMQREAMRKLREKR